MYIECSLNHILIHMNKIIACSLLVVCFQTTQAQPKSICITSKFELPGLANTTLPMAYFIGIAEGVNTNYELLPLQVEYFIQLGVKYVVIERSYADSYLYNRFLETGDEKCIEGDVEWSEEMKEALKKVYLLNQNLSAERKIKFIGIDAPNYAGSIIKTLANIFSDKVPPPNIKHFVDSIQLLNQYSSSFFWKNIKTYNETFVTYMNKEVTSNKDEYEKYLGKDFIHLRHIIENEASHLRSDQRNKDMYQNLTRILKTIPIESSLFIFGSAHVGLDYKSSLSSRVNRDSSSPFFKKVIVIDTHYEKSKAFYGGKEIDINKSLLDYKLGKSKLLITQNIKHEGGCGITISKVKDYSELKSLDLRMDYLLIINGGKPLRDLRKKLLIEKD